MFGFCKTKHILLIAAICLLIGCDTVDHDKEGFITDQKQGYTKVTSDDKLNKAITFIQDKRYPQAIRLLNQIKDNKMAEDLLKQLRYIISGTYIANLGAGIAALDNKGKIKIIIDDSLNKYYGYDNVLDWGDIKSLSFAQDRLDALDKKGIIYSTRNTDPTLSDVDNQLKSHTNLSVISTDYDNFVLLSNTGKVYVYTAKHRDALNFFKEDIATWRDVVDVVTGQLRIAALKRDGTVYVADYNKYLNPAYDYLYDEINDWSDIIAISADSVGPIAGLKSDGSVVISTSNITGTVNSYNYDVTGWNDIIAISKSNTTLLGLKRDGTVVATGSNAHKQLEVSGWRDIVAVAAGDWISIGLKSDGTLVLSGETEEGVTTPDVSGINNLYVPTIIY